jgi:hypothetical protein
MALITTVMTTPLAMWLYPPAIQQKLEARRRGELEWNGDNLAPDSFKVANASESSIEKLQGNEVKRLLVYLRLNSLPSLFTFIALLGGDRAAVSTKVHRAKSELETVKEDSDVSTTALLPKRPLEVHGIRMLELTERTSSWMKINEIDDYSGRDPVVNAFRTFAQLNNVAVSGAVSIVPESHYAETLTSQASDHFSDLVLIPWSDDSDDGVLGIDSLASGMQEAFIQKTLETATCNTAVFFNRGFGGASNVEARPVSRSSRQNQAPIQPFVDRSHHVYFPFFGGIDDRVALRFVLQLAQNSNITVTVVHFRVTITAVPAGPRRSVSVLINEASASFRGSSSKLEIEKMSPEAQQASAVQDEALLHLVRDSLSSSLGSRVMFTELPTASPIEDCLAHARKEIGQSPRNAGDLIVVGRSRHPYLVDAHEHVGNADLRKTLGVAAESIISGGVRGSVLVMQAGGRGLDN